VLALTTLWLLVHGIPIILESPADTRRPNALHAQHSIIQGLDWHTGDSFQRQLDQTVGVRWLDIPLRQALRYLPEHWRIAVFVDRRVDPDQVIRFQSDNQPLRETLVALADSLQLDVGFLDGVVYVGPPGTPDQIATLAEWKLERAEQLSGSEQQRLTRREPMRWEMLAEPRSLVADLAREADITVQNLERLPHDLWDANDLPALPWTHRMALLLAGFDLTFEWSPDATNLHIVPLPSELSLVRTYTLPGNAASRHRQLQTAFPKAELRRTGNRLEVRGTAAEHDGIRRQLDPHSGRSATGNRGNKPPRTAAAETRYTLRATNRIGVILQAVARQADMLVQPDPELETLLEQVVTLEVKEASLTELLNQLLTNHGLAYELKPKQLLIHRAP